MPELRFNDARDTGWYTKSDGSRGYVIDGDPVDRQTWLNYRGTDDNSKVAIGVDKVKFLPIGVRGLFQEAFAPAPTLSLVSTMGQEWYSRIVLDKDRDEWADIEIESHRLPICARPDALLQGNK